MKLIMTASELIAAYNGDIEALANHCMTAIVGNRILTIALIICIWTIRKRNKNAYFHLDNDSEKKLLKICDWENRARKDQVKHIIKQYIDHYSRINSIDWNEYL